jgi:hypothetical protein
MKKLSFVSSVLCMIVLLMSCTPATPPPQPPPTPAPTPAPRGFSIDLKVDKPIYQIGENIFITVRPSRDCYLTLYDISTLGEVTQIFPNHFAADNLLQAAQLYRIPSEADAFDFEVTGPPGIERVRAICSVNNVNLFSQQRQIDRNEVFPRIYVAPNQFEQTLDQQLNSIPSDQWAEASVTFEVR